ncbi:MAG: hypothetical protein RLZZ153_1791 [Pseudomonadota bacterium]|jgi:DUF1365 family protein
MTQPVQVPRLSFAFGEIRHARKRPREHAFRYRAFYVRAHLDLLESRSGNALFGVNRRAWVSLHAADHGDGSGAVRKWLQGILDQASVTADGDIWLYAFARVAGYSFKPVSFWHCHRGDGALMAIVAEVHNTFGDRHVYLLASPDGRPLKSGAELRAVKHFHVSPFCKIEGEYRFRFLDTATRTVARIDYHDANGLLLTTSMSGSLVTPARSAALRAAFGYPLFSLGVIARIHWQALQLWLSRVPFIRRPQTPADFVTRGSP